LRIASAAGYPFQESLSLDLRTGAATPPPVDLPLGKQRFCLFENGSFFSFFPSLDPFCAHALFFGARSCEGFDLKGCLFSAPQKVSPPHLRARIYIFFPPFFFVENIIPAFFSDFLSGSTRACHFFGRARGALSPLLLSFERMGQRLFSVPTRLSSAFCRAAVSGYKPLAPLPTPCRLLRSMRAVHNFQEEGIFFARRP